MRDSNSRMDYFQEEGNDSIHGGIFSFKEVSEVFEGEPKKWDTCYIYFMVQIQDEKDWGHMNHNRMSPHGP